MSHKIVPILPLAQRYFQSKQHECIDRFGFVIDCIEMQKHYSGIKLIKEDPELVGKSLKEVFAILKSRMK